MLTQKQLEKLVDDWTAEEVKAIDEACAEQIKHHFQALTSDFKAFSTAIFIEAIRRGLRKPY